MTFDGQFFARALELLFPPSFAVFALLRRSFPPWAKGLAIGAAVVGLGAAALSFLLPHYRELGLTDHDYIVLMRCKRTLVGVVMGIVISIVVACETRSRDRAERSV
jgi:hypothetical protein